jgi:hypothetical protein
MVLSDKEIAILQSVADGVKNTTGYGYQVAVHGTVVEGIVGLVCTVIALIVTIYGASKAFKWARSIKPQEYDDLRPGAYACTAMFTIILFIVTSVAAWIGLHDPLMNMLAPEYQVVNHIISVAASK